MDKKKISLLLLGGIIICLATAAYASYWIWSNQVTVTVEEYEVTLAPTSQSIRKYQLANFTATVTLDGTAVSGKIVYLYFANGTDTGISAVTDTQGEALLQWNATDTGTFTFKAGVQAP